MNEESQELEVVDVAPVEEAPAPPTSLFKTDDPALILKQATEIADVLAPVLREKGMLTKIGPNEHVQVTGWQTLGAMLGVTPVCTESNPVEDGWEARVEARTLDGRVIGAAEAECLRTEERWKTAEDYAIRSMAQTRATSKALASVLRFVVTLAGYSGTPAEEMDGVREQSGGTVQGASEKQLAFLIGNQGRQGLFDKAMLGEGQRRAFTLWSSGGPDLTKQGASKLISALKDNPEQGREKLLAEIMEGVKQDNVLAIECRNLLTDDVPADMDDADTGVGDQEDIPFS